MVGSVDNQSESEASSAKPANGDSGGEGVRGEPSTEDIREQLLLHQDSLFRLGYSLSRNEKDAEDLVQETYLRAVDKRDLFRPGSNLRAWLMTILRNAYINRYRRERKRPGEFDLAEVEPFIADQGGDERLLQNSVVEPEEWRRLGENLDDPVRRALDELPEEFREVLVMAAVEDLSYKEIAAVVGMPMGTVMSRLHRARKMMYERLREYGVETGWLNPDD